MERTDYSRADGLITAIDMGGGRVFRVTREPTASLRASDSRSGTRMTRSWSPSTAAQIVNALVESASSLEDVKRIVSQSRPDRFNDETVQDLSQYAFEHLGTDPAKAYRLFWTSYLLSIKGASFWRQALVSCMLGYFLLRNMKQAKEAIPVFQELQMVARIWENCYGASNRSQYLVQVAEQGIHEACEQMGRYVDSQSIRVTASEEIWAALLDNAAKVAYGSQAHERAENVARALIHFQTNDRSLKVEDELVRMATEYLASVRPVLGCVTRLEDAVPVVMLAEVLLANGANEHAIKVLEELEFGRKDRPILLQFMISTRQALAHYSNGDYEVALRVLDGLDLDELRAQPKAYLSVQGELWLIYIARMEIAEALGDPAAARWRSEARALERSMEPWAEIESRCREDDLRVLYWQLLKQISRPKAASHSA